jgi:hypothetical protein
VRAVTDVQMKRLLAMHTYFVIRLSVLSVPFFFFSVLII